MKIKATFHIIDELIGGKNSFSHTATNNDIGAYWSTF